MSITRWIRGGVCVAVLQVAGVALGQVGVIVDNDDGAPGYTETGSWSTGASSGYNGGSYRWTSPGAGKAATWTADLTESGDYEVFVWYLPGSNRTTSTKYDVSAADGVHTVYVDQTLGGYTWESLGTYTFNAGSYSITLDAEGSSGGSAAIADAVRWGDDGGGPVEPPEPTEIAPGVLHYKWELPTPQVNHVVAFDLADPRYTIQMGFAQGVRNYTAKQPVDEIVTYYAGGQEVIAAINAAFFSTGIDFLGFAGSDGNVIQAHLYNAGVEQTYVLQGNGRGSAASSIAAMTGTARFEDGVEMVVGLLDYPCGSGTLALFTPDWGSSTGSTATGVEVVVENVNYPLRPNKWVQGEITAVHSGASSLDNDIPAGGFVLSACSGAAGDLLEHVVVGQSICVKLAMTPAELANARTMATGTHWVVRDGEVYQDNWPERHPRTVIAWSGTQHWFVTFDGRQSEYAVGASLAEVADFVINYLGAENAINLDGGGSTTLVIDGEVANCPSDNASTPCTGTPRAVPNALMLVQRDATTGGPLDDSFAGGVRSLTWDDKFSFNPVVSFSPSAPGGDGQVLEVINPAGGHETVSVGQRGDRNCTVEAWIYCEHRPDVVADGFERVGIFARDDGNGNFEASTIGGGNCYALTYDTDTGRTRAGVVVDGTFTDFLEVTPLYAPTTAWRKFRIECNEVLISYYVDDELVAEVVDDRHALGRFGIGHHEYFATDALAHGTRAEDFSSLCIDFDFDYDGDGDVDGTDFLYFAYCWLGPGEEFAPVHFCTRFDTDGDLDVDAVDFAVFQIYFTGS